jgi:DNA-binding PadR family transcriptional regulator
MATRTAPLGEFELLVLLSTIALGDAAYPVAIATDIAERTGRKANRTTVLITLERLEDKDLVSSRYGDATPERGGRPKRFFALKAAGLDAVRQSVARVQTMTHGLEDVLRPRR